ncbi:MAG: FkbM family methyltransferase [Oscillospiraceae bacterium]|nr:FkbM family methyltransferase [Oscillospiraceae bacterium]
MKLYTRILHFLLRDLYARIEAERQETALLRNRLSESQNQITAFQESSAMQAAILQKQNQKLQEKVKLLHSQLAAVDQGNQERTQRCEKRLDCLEHYRSETENRMRSDDRTTLELAHRMEILEQITQDQANAFQKQNFKLFDKKSYAQAGEDAIILYACAMLGIPFAKCSYLDLGANKPVEMNNSYLFYQQGARGVLVEANPALIPDLEKTRPGDVVLNRAVTERSGEEILFQVLNLDGLSKIGDISEILAKNPDAQLQQQIAVRTISVNDIIREYFHGTAPVIINLDIEGLELEILESIDFETYRPLFFIIEMIPYSENLVVNQKDWELVDYMQRMDYQEYAFTGINSIFIDDRQYQKIIAEKSGGKLSHAGE